MKHLVSLWRDVKVWWEMLQARQALVGFNPQPPAVWESCQVFTEVPRRTTDEQPLPDRGGGGLPSLLASWSFTGILENPQRLLWPIRNLSNWRYSSTHFLTWALDEGEYSSLRPGRCNLGKEHTITDHYFVWWTRAALDASRIRGISFSVRNRTLVLRSASS
jgi:hypothetical protein